MTDAWIIELSFSYEGDSSDYLIWYTDDNGKDRIYSKNNKIIIFISERSAKEFMSNFNFKYCDTVFYDAERLLYWTSTGHDHHIYLPSSETQQVDCEFLLNFWNLFTDIAHSIALEFEPTKTKQADKCYNKLFAGCNTAVNVGNYIPEFNRKELEFIRELMKRGIDIYTNNSE